MNKKFLVDLHFCMNGTTFIENFKQDSTIYAFKT